MVWLGTPIDPALATTMRAVAPAAMAAYTDAEKAFLAGRRYLGAPAGFPATDFLDLDHLDTSGGARLAALLAPALAEELRVAGGTDRGI